MIKTAVLADIHGNLPALEAVLAEVEKVGADRIVLNGDLADGPFPAETLDLLMTLGKRALWLRGNGDRWLVEGRDRRFRHDDQSTAQLIAWASTRITSAHRDLLAELPLTRSIDFPDLGRVGFCHATSRSDNEMLLVDSPIEHYRAAFSLLEAQTIVVDHCHQDVVLHRTIYDIDEASFRISQTGMPGAEEFIRTNIRSTPSDQEALDAFHLVLRKQQDVGCFD